MNIATRWGDQDRYGHVNNVVQLELVQEARTRFFQQCAPSRADGGPMDGAYIIVTHQEVEYLAQMPYLFAEGVDAVMWIASATRAEMVVGIELRNPHDDTLYTRATTSVVMLDPEKQRIRRLTPGEMDFAKSYAGEPVVFRRRPKA